MSGHSKWSTIKHKKAKQDAARGKEFTKLGRAITIAAREGGGDEDSNFVLRLIVEKAKKASMPMDNIERAIKRGTGESTEGALENVTYGGYGPGGVAVVVDALTDNTNRTVSEVRKIFEDHGGSLTDSSSVLWQFVEKGRIVVKCAVIEKSQKYGEEDKEAPVDNEDVMMTIMDIDGVEDIRLLDEQGLQDEDIIGGIEGCEVITNAKKLAQVRDEIQQIGYIVSSMEIIKVAENTQALDESTSNKLQKLLEALDEHDDVDNLWFNADLS